MRLLGNLGSPCWSTRTVGTSEKPTKEGGQSGLKAQDRKYNLMAGPYTVKVLFKGVRGGSVPWGRVGGGGNPEKESSCKLSSDPDY